LLYRPATNNLLSTGHRHRLVIASGGVKLRVDYETPCKCPQAVLRNTLQSE
jgi:hypothetical protein